MIKRKQQKELPTIKSWRVFDSLFKAHPWHGVPIGENAPELVMAYIEMVPTDVVKYEIDKTSGYLKVDRPQKYSSQCPALYGFIPQTLSGDRVGAHTRKRTRIDKLEGDGDPIDICILTERPITHGDILLQAIPIGGLRMLDGIHADDKLIAVLKEDALYGEWRDISDAPSTLIERLCHYFLTYKDIPGGERRVDIRDTYDAAEAKRIISLSRKDYKEQFKEVSELFEEVQRE